jgi:hypothetical protein
VAPEPALNATRLLGICGDGCSFFGWLELTIKPKGCALRGMRFRIFCLLAGVVESSASSGFRETTGVLEIKIQAASVDTGSGMKDDKLRSKDFFDVKQDPLITFHSTKIVQTGPNTFDVSGKFTIRGVTKDETFHLVVSGRGRSVARTTA